jgi:hypothetical protein
MTFKIEGFDDFQKKIEELKEKAQEMGGTCQLAELLSPEFMASCSAFSSMEELFDASGFKVKTQEDFAAIPESDWEWFIQQNTSYTSWAEMQQAAAAIWMKKKLNS